MRRGTFNVSDLRLVAEAPSADVPPLVVGDLCRLNSGGPACLVVEVSDENITMAVSDGTEYVIHRDCVRRAKWSKQQCDSVSNAKSRSRWPILPQSRDPERSLSVTTALARMLHAGQDELRWTPTKFGKGQWKNRSGHATDPTLQGIQMALVLALDHHRKVASRSCALLFGTVASGK